ncbi:MAG: hypothetical protein HZA35_02560 [Parcubacteria group bacterium]|nr:hypothetical protein [Parcubacteria group bacterium]
MENYRDERVLYQAIHDEGKINPNLVCASSFSQAIQISPDRVFFKMQFYGQMGMGLSEKELLTIPQARSRVLSTSSAYELG